MKYINVLIAIILFHIMFRKIYTEYKYVVITGASLSHELSLIQLLYYCLLNTTHVYIHIWDLGLSKEFKNTLKRIIIKYKNIQYHYFNFSFYPKYFNINQKKGEYAWKSVIINISYYSVKSTLLWLDSGCKPLKSLNKIFQDIEIHHVLSIFSCGAVSKWTHIGMIKYFNVSNNITRKRTCAGGIVGFKWKSQAAELLLKEWVDCSFHKECIAPKGSNRMNHRQDQSALSILLYKHKLLTECPINIYKIKTHCDLHNISIAQNMINKIMKMNYLH